MTRQTIGLMASDLVKHAMSLVINEDESDGETYRRLAEIRAIGYAMVRCVDKYESEMTR